MWTLWILTVLIGLLCVTCAWSSYRSTGQLGPIGSQGLIGLSGAQGPTGDLGPVGPVGPSGAKGPLGDLGPQGFPGHSIVGPTGAIGPTGAFGPTGAIGPTGATGIEPSWIANVTHVITDSDGVIHVSNDLNTWISYANPSFYGSSGPSGGVSGPVGPSGEMQSACSCVLWDGRSWTLAYKNTLYNTVWLDNVPYNEFNPNLEYINSILRTNDTLYAAGSGIASSMDNGLTWALQVDNVNVGKIISYNSGYVAIAEGVSGPSLYINNIEQPFHTSEVTRFNDVCTDDKKIVCVSPEKSSIYWLDNNDTNFQILVIPWPLLNISWNGLGWLGVGPQGIIFSSNYFNNFSIKQTFLGTVINTAIHWNGTNWIVVVLSSSSEIYSLEYFVGTNDASTWTSSVLNLGSHNPFTTISIGSNNVWAQTPTSLVDAVNILAGATKTIYGFV